MCIALLSTAHPKYKLILIDNRDEYINRPTAFANWWSTENDLPESTIANNDDVLGGRDLLKAAHGTWLGITKRGKIAVLTNFRETVIQPTTPSAPPLSRGEIIKKFLTEDWNTADFVHEAVNTGVAQNAGGFSLVCGHVDEQLAIVSNRAHDGSEVPWICGPVVQTVGLSNTYFGDRTWPKVVDGEVGLLHAIRENLHTDASEDAFVVSLLELLSTDSLTPTGIKAEDGLDVYVQQLRNTILVPPLGRKDLTGKRADEIAAAKSKSDADANGPEKGDEERAKILSDNAQLRETKQLGVSGIYATQKQTVVLIDHNDRVRFVEKSLFNEEGEPVSDDICLVDMSFTIQRRGGS